MASLRSAAAAAGCPIALIWPCYRAAAARSIQGCLVELKI